MNDFSLPEELWELPSSPLVVHRLLELIPLSHQKDAPLRELVGWDPALTLRIIAAARSIHPQVNSLEQAAGILGEQAFRLLALQFRLIASRSQRAFFKSFWRHQQFLFAAAMTICEKKDQGNLPNVSPAVSVRYLDRLALIQRDPQTAEEVFEEALDTRKSWGEILEARHPDIAGDSMADRLGNEALVASPANAILETSLGFAELAATYMLCAEDVSSDSTQPIPDPAEDGDPISEFLEDIARYIEQRFPADSRKPPAFEEMLSRANRELGRLAFDQSRKDRAAKSQALEKIFKHEKTISQLEHEALRDPLTEIYNRRFFLESLRQEAARCQRRGAPIGLLFLDVDAFKSLNDTWGHLVGDQVLKQVGATLKGVLRGADVLARFGGEEFVVLPNDPTETGILLLAERLRSAVESLVVPVEEDAISVTISVGCTLIVPKNKDKEVPQQLLASADAAMYDAKQMGRNRVVFRSLLDESERALMQQTIDCSFSRWLTQRDIISEEDLETAMMDYVPERVALGELAIELDFLTDEQVTEILKRQAAGGERFGTLALRLKWITPEQLAFLLARQRENPQRLAGLLVERKLLEEKHADQLVKQYLAFAMG